MTIEDFFSKLFDKLKMNEGTIYIMGLYSFEVSLRTTRNTFSTACLIILLEVLHA